MRRRCLLAAGLFVLAVCWFVPWRQLVPGGFAAHMIVHMGVVAIAAPLVALGLAGGPADPVRRVPSLFPPIPISIIELLVVWAWHAPALHHGARHSTALFWLEQVSFLAAGLAVWLAAFGGAPHARADRRAAGIVALLLTFMHMTLLGALLGLSPRALYDHPGPTAESLVDQHLGGVLMVLAGAVSYLAGGLWLMIDMLRARGESR
jgi:putative membrane protein